MPHRTLLPARSLEAALIASALLLAPAPGRAGAVTSAAINGLSDADTQDVAASAAAATAGPGAVGSAAAEADLATGTLKARAAGDSGDVFGFLDADASAELLDVLFLTPDAGSPSSPVPFTLFMDLDGVLQVDGDGVASPNLQIASARAVATLGISGFAVSCVAPASLTVTRRVQAAGGSALDDSTTVDLEQNVTGVATPALDVRLTATAMVTPSSAIDVRAFLAAEASAEAAFSSAADLAQTGRLGVIVPAGYSLSSASGSFLTAPEPGAAAPFAATGAALLFLARRRARRGARAAKA